MKSPLKDYFVGKNRCLSFFKDCGLQSRHFKHRPIPISSRHSSCWALHLEHFLWRLQKAILIIFVRIILLSSPVGSKKNVFENLRLFFLLLLLFALSRLLEFLMTRSRNFKKIASENTYVTYYRYSLWYQKTQYFGKAYLESVRYRLFTASH